MVFKNGQEMLDAVNAQDLYNEKTGFYVFLYSDDGALAFYYISPEEAKNLEEKVKAIHSAESVYWSEFLGIGGHVVHPNEALEFCNGMFPGEWKSVSDKFNNFQDLTTIQYKSADWKMIPKLSVEDAIFLLDDNLLPDCVGDFTKNSPREEDYNKALLYQAVKVLVDFAMGELYEIDG